MEWYLATLVMSRDRDGVCGSSAGRCHYLLRASSNDNAYAMALDLEVQLTVSSNGVAELNDLLMIYEEPQHGAELMWNERELTPDALDGEVRATCDMRAFQLGATTSGWYLADVVLYESHETGSHGEKVLVWINSYLIKAPSALNAYHLAVEMGRKHEEGTHLCDGDVARWTLKGIKNIIPLENAPREGALLWCDPAEEGLGSPENGKPSKSTMSVFKWERRRSTPR